MVFVLDNYDSFTYNLVQYLGELGAEVVVRRNDEIDVDGVEAMHPERILLSPGPCTPQEAGISIELVRRFAGKVPLLGVCLGHQAIGAAFGGEIVRAPRLMHGKTSEVQHDGKTIFRGLPSPDDSHALPLANRARKKPARGAGDQRIRRGKRRLTRDYGPAPQTLPRGRRPIPSGKRPNWRGEKINSEFPAYVNSGSPE